MVAMFLRRIALTCAVLMLFGFSGDRTTWVWRRRTVTEGAVYNLATTACGIIALIGLAVALGLGARLVVPLLGFAAAIGSFALAALVAGVSVWALLQGEVWFYGAAGQYTGPLGDVTGNTLASAQTVSPARAPWFFTVVAGIGAVATLGLAATWLAGDRIERAADATGSRTSARRAERFTGACGRRG